MRKQFVWAAAALFGVVGASAPAAAQQLEIMTSLPSLGFPFFVHMQDELSAEAAMLGDITIVATDGQNSTPKQAADVEAAIVQGVDGIVISPKDAVAMAPALQEAVDAGIPVVTIDRRVEGVPGILGHVGADNVKGGEAQGAFIKALFPDGARVMNLQGQPGSSPAIDRNAGVHNVLDGDDRYVFIFEDTAQFAREEAVRVTEAALAGLNEPPDVIVAANDDMALGALTVLEEKALDIPVIGFDALPEALKSIRDGKLTATVEQFPGGQSSGALKTLVEFLRNGVKPAQQVTLLTPIIITKDNIEDAERLGEVQ